MKRSRRWGSFEKGGSREFIAGEELPFVLSDYKTASISVHDIYNPADVFNDKLS